MSAITELPNELSSDLDLLSPIGIVRLFRTIDAQLFSGYKHYTSLYDQECLELMVYVATKVKQVIENNRNEKRKMKGDNLAQGCVVLAGCGTSGRLAALLAGSFNEILQEKGDFPVFKYCLAGGDAALVKSEELTEDSADAGCEDLKKIVNDCKGPIVYIGITCGMSAAYVAGQLKYIIDNDLPIYSCLISFNPCENARSAIITSSSFTSFSFKNVVQNIQSAIGTRNEHCIYNESVSILNPIVGPELVTGSSRLKGGSMTRILVETIFLSSLTTPSIKIARGLIENYELIYRRTYSSVDVISKFVEITGSALRSKGKVFIFGAEKLGSIGFIDATEQAPTFGTHVEDYRGVTLNGWKDFRNANGDLSHVITNSIFQVGYDYFSSNILPTLSCNDVVIITENMDSKCKMLTKAINGIILQSKLKFFQVLLVKIGEAVASEDLSPNCLILETGKVLFEGINISNGFLDSFALKLVLNIVSTGAHVIKGNVFGNRMINVTVSNNKLFDRAVNIISVVAKVSKNSALQCLLRSIYDDSPEKKLDTENIQKHIIAARSKSFVVPIAILLADGIFENTTIARNEILRQPILRILLTENDRF